MEPILTALDLRFVTIDTRSRKLLALIPESDLYRRPRVIKHDMTPFSCGEYVLRSAAMVEQTFGGITTRLWDDPYEWTLPEKLSTKAHIIDYLDETESTRRRGFDYLSGDAELTREIPAPEKLRSIIDVLLEALSMADHYQGRAFAVFQMLFDERLPRI